ncbi:protein phosphatase regulatory subunit A, partial [Nosema bombycis CQ1]
MNSSEVEILLKEFESSSDKLEWWIGKNKSTTDQIAHHLQSHPLSLDHLQLCSLLLLEKYDSMIEIIRNILIQNPNRSRVFLNDLLKSPFYNQRMAIPSFLIDNPYNDILLKCFYDNSGVVIREAVLSLKKYKIIPFSQDELLNLALSLNNHKYDFIQCLVPEILIHIHKPTFLISEICMSKSWRKRLALALRVKFYGITERFTIYNLLHKDPEEFVRCALVENLNCIQARGDMNGGNEGKGESMDIVEDTIEDINNDPINPPTNTSLHHFINIFIKDPSEKVRKQLIKVIGNNNEYYDHLKILVDDPSWLVRKELLCIHNEDIYESISLPLISSLPVTYDWRIKIEILESISQIADKNPKLIRKCLTEILFSYLGDKVNDIREKSNLIVKKLINTEEWV